MLSHDKKPELSDLSEEEFQNLVQQITNTPYHKHIEGLRKYVVGRKVVTSTVGASGYLLYLDNDSWVLSFFDDEKFDWRVGSNEPSASELELLNLGGITNGESPLEVDLPYADEICDIQTEIAHSHGKQIVNLSIGERNFNFCFPDGLELDVMLFPSDDGRIVWRVFWEQW